MAVPQEFVAEFTAWSNHFAEPQAEAELVAHAQDKAKELLLALSLPLDQDDINLAVSIALAENAERVQAIINEECKTLIASTLDSQEFKNLNIKNLAEAKTFIEGIGLQCYELCQGIVRRYAPEPNSHTSSLLKLKRLRKYCEDFLFSQLVTEDATQLKNLLHLKADYYLDLQAKVTMKLQELRDSASAESRKLTEILRSVYAANPPVAMHTIPKTFWKEIVNNRKEATLVALRNDLVPYVNTWLTNIMEGTLGIFADSMMTEGTKKMVLAAATYCVPAIPAEIVGELQRVLGVQGPAISQEDFGSALEGFQNGFQLQEKYFTLLCLILFFSEAGAVLNTTRKPRCHPVRRHYNRALVLRLLTRDQDSFPENEWVLVHHIEEIVGHFLQPNDSEAVAKLMVEEWNSTKGCCDTTIKIFDFSPLTSSLYPSLHVTIAISGWMSENTDMLENWKSIVSHLHYGAVYALNWEAGTETSEIAKGAMGAAGVVGSAFIPIVGIIAAPVALYGLWKNQPFQTAAKRAEETGRCLAYHIKNRAFGNVSVSLICFSLGARVTAFCLDALADEENQYIQDVVLFGGAMSLDGWDRRKQAVAGRLINVHSDQDSILTYAYQAARFEKPVGLNPIPVAGVTNFNASTSVFGHMDHKSKFDKSMTTLNYIP